MNFLQNRLLGKKYLLKGKVVFSLAVLFCLSGQYVYAAQALQILPPTNLRTDGPLNKTAVGNVILSTANKNYMSSNIKWYEAHWQGMDTMELDRELKMKLGYPSALQGIFVIEVTMNAAVSGMLAGDIIIAVEAMDVIDLKSFQAATRKIQYKKSAAVSVVRKGGRVDGKLTLNKRVFVINDLLELGFAQVESAPMIVPGEFRPHRYRGACTDCHAIGEGFQLAQDPDLITLPPPIITKQQSLGKPPHEDKGQCRICHQINATVN